MAMTGRILLEVRGAEPVRTDVLVGEGILGELAGAAGGRTALVVTDRNVAATPWPGRVVDVLGASARSVALTEIAPGDAAKTVAGVEALWATWSKSGAGRDSVVIAVGGGVVTDLGGFAAATFLRGVPWMAVPTTVLGMADAAIGGKVGVNTAMGKNLAGALHHPERVVADIETLSTLPDEDFMDGWAEIVKAGAIGDAGLFEDVVAAASAIRSRSSPSLAALLERSVRVKVSVVQDDPRETSRREILNFGHAVGHALEHATDHALSHGRAVAAGMVVEARVGAQRGWLPAEVAERVAAACRALGLPDRAPAGVAAVSLAEALAVDKKRRSGHLRIALPTGLGTHEAACGHRVEIDELVRATLGNG